jgi:hypothetical protein
VHIHTLTQFETWDVDTPGDLDVLGTEPTRRATPHLERAVGIVSIGVDVSGRVDVLRLKNSGRHHRSSRSHDSSETINPDTSGFRNDDVDSENGQPSSLALPWPYKQDDSKDPDQLNEYFNTSKSVY